MSFSVIAGYCPRGNEKFDAEVALTLYDAEAEPCWSTQQRTVATGLTSREEARAAAERWIMENLGPIFNKLPKAKP